MSLATRIAFVRGSRGRTRRDLARAVGTSPAWLQKLEEGRLANPSFTRLMRLAKELDVSLDYLVDQKAEPGLSQEALSIAISVQKLLDEAKKKR